VAFVILSSGHLTRSRARILPARPVAFALVAVGTLLMGACLAAGYQLGRTAAPSAAATPAPGLKAPEYQALARRVGTLAAQLARLDGQATAMAARLGVAPAAVTLARSAANQPSGGPVAALGGLDRVDDGLRDLETRLAVLSGALVRREAAAMAFPSRSPVAGSRIPVSSQFGTRQDPFTGRLARHTGLDIPAPHGTPILASGGGRVVFAGRKGAYGLATVIDHGDGLATLYGHASRLLVAEGDVVLPQQKIALVGSTGRSTGPHLHFEVIRGGQRVEPRGYLAHVLHDPARDAAR
jgi:murein DD-endopeptidase MepM/ murein hydrolase activator NlpD